jgi:hypothetical protein
MEITINLENYPHLKELFDKDKTKAREAITACLNLAGELEPYFEMVEPFDAANLEELLKDVVHGVLDHEGWDTTGILGYTAHPFGRFKEKGMPLPSGEDTFFNWQKRWGTNNKRLLLSKMLKYFRYLDFEQLAKALRSDELHTHYSMRDKDSLIPIQPALVYQHKNFGELQVGKFVEDTGFFDCGVVPELWENDECRCPACGAESENLIYRTDERQNCLRCGSSFSLGGENNG